MKIASKCLHVNVIVEDIIVGSIKTDVELMMFITSDENGMLQYDIDIAEYLNVTFEGKEVDSSYKGQFTEIREFYESNGVDLDAKINKQALEKFNKQTLLCKITKGVVDVKNLLEILA